MPLPTPNLDDRRFQDLVDEAKRLIPQYCPTWTNHNVADPGVALIELFAWMSEMVLYRVNQVPDRLYAHFLNLVGIEPLGPSTATVDVTFWLSAALASTTAVPAGTEITTPLGASGAVEPVVFMTRSELRIVPPRLIQAVTVSGGDSAANAIDVSADLQREPGATCFAELRSGAALCLGFEQSLAGVVLRLDLSAQAKGLGVDPTRPPVAWEVWDGRAWIRCTVHEDTTGGLNRDGSIILLVPNKHEEHLLGGESAYWLRVVLRGDPLTDQPTYEVSPRVWDLRASALGGTVQAEHAEPVLGETVGRSDGTPAQEFQVSRPPVLRRGSGEVVRVHEGGEVTTWIEVSDFSESELRDRHVTWDDASGIIRFGPRVRQLDGTYRQHGAIPREGSIVEVSAYRTGGGARGNVAAGTLTALRENIAYINGVTNLDRASGGADGETLDETRVRGPMALRTGQRAVTVGDFEQLTRAASSSVARVRCRAAQDPGGPITILVVPQVPRHSTEHTFDDFALTADLSDTITAHLDRHRLIGTAIELGVPYYQGVSVAVLARRREGSSADEVQQRITGALHRYLDPIQGGPTGDGWPFETDISSVTIAQLVESLDGVKAVDEVYLFDADAENGRRLGQGKHTVTLDRDSLFLSVRPQVVVR